MTEGGLHPGKAGVYKFEPKTGSNSPSVWVMVDKYGICEVSIEAMAGVLGRLGLYLDEFKSEVSE